MIKYACKQIYRGNMPVTELYTFNLTCVILLMALYGVALNIDFVHTADLNALRKLRNDHFLRSTVSGI